MPALLPATIPGRLTATIFALFLVVTAPVVIVILRSAGDGEERQAEQRYAEMAAVVAEAMGQSASSGDPIQLQIAVERFAPPTGARVFVVDQEATVIADSAGDPSAAGAVVGSPIFVVTEVLAERPRASADDQGRVLASAPIPDVAGRYVVIQSPLGTADAETSDLWREALIGVAFAAVIVAALSLLIARRISTPLAELRAQAMAISSGDLDVAAQPASVAELGDLARAFNAMAARIRELLHESADARERLEAIFNNLSDGVLVIGADQQITAANARAHQLLMLPPQDVIGAPFLVAVRDHDLANLLETAMSTRRTVSEPISYARSGRQIEATAIPVLYDRERLAIMVVRDVTELRRLEQVRREFVANVSHELRTPLASIRALVETLEAGAIDDPEVSSEFLRRIVGETDRLTALVEELLDLARLESGRVQLRLQPVAAPDLVTDAAERLRPQVERAGLELEVVVPTNLGHVLVDRERIEQVILNLVHNAIKFTPPGGTISIRAAQRGSMVRIDVADTGAGIPESELSRIFERFFKGDRARRSEGTGLGLAIAKHIVLSHKGEIWATSEPGEGSVFSFTIPLDRPPVAASTRSPEKPPSRP